MEEVKEPLRESVRSRWSLEWRCVVDKSTAKSRTFRGIGTIGASKLPLSEAQRDDKGFLSIPVLTEYEEILNCNFLPREETSQDEAVMIWSSVVKWLFKTNNSQAYEVSKIFPKQRYDNVITGKEIPWTLKTCTSKGKIANVYDNSQQLLFQLMAKRYEKISQEHCELKTNVCTTMHL